MKKKFLFLIMILFLNSVIFGLANDYLIVMGSKLNIRKEPNLNSKVLTQMKFLTTVKLLKRSGKKISIGNLKGEWVYVEAYNTPIGKKNPEDIKGWTFDYYLAGNDKFKPANKLARYSIKKWMGDFLVSFITNFDGTYVREVYDYEKDKISKRNGQFFKYRNVYMAKDHNHKGFMLFYMNKRNELCHESGVCMRKIK